MAEYPSGPEPPPPLPDISASLRARHAEWSLVRVVLPPGIDALGAAALPLLFFAAPTDRGPAPAGGGPGGGGAPAVRPAAAAAPGDRLRWEPLFLAYRASQIAPGPAPEAPPEAAAAATWGAYTAEPNAALLALGPSGELLGVAHVAAAPRGAGRPWAFLSDVFVSPTARRRGVGQALMRAALDWACRAGAEELRWFCLEGNEAALAFYEGLGFKASSAVTWQYVL